MKDPSTGARLYGRTRWRRFLLLMTPAVGIVTIVMFLVATGVIAVSFAISGIPFSLNASELKGTNFVQYATIDQTTNSGAGGLVNAASPGSSNIGTDGKAYDAATVTVLGTASLTDLDQVICAPIPAPLSALFDTAHSYLKVELKAATGGTIDTSSAVSATNLTVDAPLLQAGTAAFTNINIGEDLGAALGGPNNGQFSQAASAVDIHGIQQLAIGTSAGTFTLPNLGLAATFAPPGC